MMFIEWHCIPSARGWQSRTAVALLIVCLAETGGKSTRY